MEAGRGRLLSGFIIAGFMSTQVQFRPTWWSRVFPSRWTRCGSEFRPQSTLSPLAHIPRGGGKQCITHCTSPIASAIPSDERTP